MSYRTILVAYDGSEPSLRALNKAIEFAAHWNASLEVIHVYQIPIASVGEAMVPAAPETNAAIAHEAQNRGDEAKSIIAATPGIRANVTVKQGDPGPLIVETAADKQADLIVIGSRGNSGLKQLFLGSVSQHVIQHTACSVHVVK
ncbi:universal stress protein [Paenibacillus tarimensis]|uniref:universal stress protein n=1 Tax=Paenibacillus tarimensis TaxID=416012 RepID=UPI001F16201A|nr:universal stress protein [Paenibacillus tarimensis]MCF2945022.1 universal stress protein [Paenibacillus tarimensis]